MSTPDSRKRTRIAVAGVIGVALTLAALGLPVWAAEPEAAAVKSEDTGGQRVVVGATPKEEPYADKWRPRFLYLSESAIFMPDSNEEILGSALAKGVLTGLAAAPCGDVLVYALTTPGASQLITLTISLDREERVGDSAAIGEDAWFHDPISLSPNKRWLLATVSSKRQDALKERGSEENQARSSLAAQPGDLWLLDCEKKTPPRRVAQQALLQHCAWAPMSRRAVCLLAPGGGPDVRAVLLDVESGDVKRLVDGAAHALWSFDGSKIHVLTANPDGGERLDFDMAGDSVPSTGVRLLVRRFPRNAVWSNDGKSGAFVEEEGVAEPEAASEKQGGSEKQDAREEQVAGRKQAAAEEKGALVSISVLSPLGSVQTAQIAGRGRNLLGWSCGGELLAYAGADGCLHFRVGTLSTAACERWVSIMPEVKGVASPREAYDIETSTSPVKVAPRGTMAAWVVGAKGPCLIYVEMPSTGRQEAHVLAFRRMSLAEFGIDVKADVREQITKQVSTSNLRQVVLALKIYAGDHENRLPPHGTGDELLQDLRPYIGSPALMSSPYGAGVIKVVLLYPGEDIRQFEAKELTRMPIVELWSDYGQIYVGYASGGVERLQ